MRWPTALLSLSLIALPLLVTCSVPLAAQRSSMTSEEAAKLKAFLRDYLRGSDKQGDSTTRYFAVPVDLTDGGGEIIAYFTDQHSCGTGGCTTLIVAPSPSSYKVITSITIAWPPIRVLSTKTNGWHDLGVWVQGGGIQPGYEADLKFDGRAYPRNPSIPPAEHMGRNVAGRVVIPKDVVGVPLY